MALLLTCTAGCDAILGLGPEPGIHETPDADAQADVDDAMEAGDGDAVVDTAPPPPTTSPMFFYGSAFGIAAFATVDTTTAELTTLDTYDQTDHTPLFSAPQEWDHMAGDADLLVFHPSGPGKRKFGHLVGGKWEWLGETTSRTVDLAASLGPGRIVDYESDTGCLVVESTSTKGVTQIANDCPGLKGATHLLSTAEGDVVLYKSTTGEGYRSRLNSATGSIPGWKVGVFGKGWKMLGMVGDEIIAVGTPTDPRRRRAFRLVPGDVEAGIDVTGPVLTRNYELMTALSNGLLMFYVGEGGTGGSIEFGRIEGTPATPSYVPVKVEKDHRYNGYWTHLVPL